MNLFQEPPKDDDDPFAGNNPFAGSLDRLLNKSEEAIHDAADLLREYEKEEKIKAPKLVKDSYQYKRSIKDITAMYPGWYTKSEHYASIYGGGMVKRDFGGFADLCGVSHSRFIAVQITTVDQVGPHIRKYVSDAKSGGLGDMTIEQNLRAFLQNGGTFVILGYHKPGSRWECKSLVVTEATLDAAIARKRKK